jgi:hypothetical protein
MVGRSDGLARYQYTIAIPAFLFTILTYILPLYLVVPLESNSVCSFLHILQVFKSQTLVRLVR